MKLWLKSLSGKGLLILKQTLPTKTYFVYTEALKITAD